MAAFMARVRADFAKKTNAGAWGYMVVDALAADDPATAQSCHRCAGRPPPPEWMSANHLRPWVYAVQRPRGRCAEPRCMKHAQHPARQRRCLAIARCWPRGWAILEAALAIYDEAPDTFDRARPAEADIAHLFRARARVQQPAPAGAAPGRTAARRSIAMRKPSTLLTRLLAASPGRCLCRRPPRRGEERAGSSEAAHAEAGDGAGAGR